MQTQAVNSTASHSIQPSYPLSNEVKTESWYDFIYNPKSIQPIKLGAEQYVMAGKLILDLYPWESLFYGQDSKAMAHRPAVSTANLMVNGQPNTPSISKKENSLMKYDKVSTEAQNKFLQAEENRHTIQEVINDIFHYKQFQKNGVMANSTLQKLVVVRQARQNWLSERQLPLRALSERNQAHILREFLTTCLDEELCPDPNDAEPEDLSQLTVAKRNKWIEYFILRWQYVDGCSRKEVEIQLEQKKYFIPGGTYARRLKAARERLATLIWQKEIRARKAQS